MPVMVAIRQLVGDWGNVDADQTFSTDEQTALSLESRGLATRWRPPVAKPTGKPLESPENRMMKVPETK